MGWVNIFGLVFIVVIMIPNMIFAIRCKDGFDNKWKKNYVEMIEQVGRFGCFGFMIMNIPGTWYGWWSDEAFAIYLIVDVILVLLYCIIWIVCFKKNHCSSLVCTQSYFDFIQKCKVGGLHYVGN